VTSKTLLLHQIEFSPIAVLGGASPDVNSATAKLPSDLRLVAQTALECDADITPMNDPSWFPYVEEFDEFGVLLANADVLERRHSEIFVRGHDIPWAFSSIMWGLTWAHLHQMGESRLFAVGIRFLDKAHQTKLDDKTQDDARILMFNRLANLCFTRDRLLFLDMHAAGCRQAR